LNNLELTDSGYLVIPSELARRHFPKDVLVVLPRGKELWLLPTRGPEAGGLLLKQRNLKGDRSVLVWELLPDDTSPGRKTSFWDEDKGALRMALV
jgi:hypothetical protein